METPIRRLTKPAVVVALLGILLFQTLSSMRLKSPTNDEFSHHIASGYSYLLTGDFRMNPAQPPLPKLLSAIPLWFLKAKAPMDHPSWREGNTPVFAREFFYHSNHNADQLVFWARFPIAILSVLFGLFVFWAGQELFGFAGGICALILYVFCPDLVAHSGLATSDLSVAFFFFLACWWFRKYLLNPTWVHLTIVGILTGLCFLSKFSAVVLLPIFFLIALIAGKFKEIQPKKTAVFLAVTLLTIWAGYFFEVKPLLQNTPDPAKKIALIRKIGGEGLVGHAHNTPTPLATFSSAFTGMMITRAQGSNSFLMGEWSRTGWWYYYFVAFFIKNTLPFIVFCFLGLIVIRKIGLDRLSAATLLTPVIFFFLATMPDRAQVGIRYFLPVYPMLFLLAGAAAVFCWRKNTILKLLVIVLLSWHVLEAAWIYPHHLAYFNESIGGPKNGYKYLRDSNIDWGQDLKLLGEYVHENQIPEVALFFYGPADPSYYKIRHRPFEPEEFTVPRQSVYAIGAHNVDAVKWTEKLAPTTMIGYSIFIYDLRQKGILRNPNE